MNPKIHLRVQPAFEMVNGGTQRDLAQTTVISGDMARVENCRNTPRAASVHWSLVLIVV